MRIEKLSNDVVSEFAYFVLWDRFKCKRMNLESERSTRLPQRETSEMTKCLFKLILLPSIRKGLIHKNIYILWGYMDEIQARI